MKRLLVLVVCLLLSVSSANAAESMGKYVGIRETPESLKLATLEARHFELVQSGQMVEADKLMNSQIIPLRKSFKQLICWLENQVYTITAPGVFNVSMHFEQLSEKEGKDGGADVFGFQISTTLQQYEEIFESSKEVKLLPVDGIIYDSWVTSVINGDKRQITIYQENKKEPGETKVFKRQTCVIEMETNQITSIGVTKERKHGLLPGLRPSFAAKIIMIGKEFQGLSLRDNGEMGRLTDRNNILKALADKSEKNFRNLLDEENSIR